MSDHDDHNHDEIDCTIAIEQLYAYLDGELDSVDDKVKFEQHLEHCRSCFTRIELEKKLGDRLRGLSDDGVPTQLTSRLNKLIDKL